MYIYYIYTLHEVRGPGLLEERIYFLAFCKDFLIF